MSSDPANPSLPDSQTATRPKSRPASYVANLALLCASIVVFLAAAELALRISGFSFLLYPKDIEFGRPDPVMLEQAFLQDDELFWVTRDYPEKLESLQIEQPPLLLIGDSCTHLGRWDEALASQAAVQFDAQLSWGNLAVAGWSSHQGRAQMARDVGPLAPEVITVYFGWNDHWIGFGVEDKTIAQLNRIFSSRLSRSRLVQLATKTVVAWRTRSSAYPNRVSLEDFENNLRSIASLARSYGAIPVFLTAASNHREGNEPAELEQRWLRDLSDLVPLHQSYVEVVRNVAQQTDVPLCDLARAIEQLPQERRDTLFMADGIHFTPAGNQHLAELIYACFARQDLWPRLLPPSSHRTASDAAASPPPDS